MEKQEFPAEPQPPQNPYPEQPSYPQQPYPEQPYPQQPYPQQPYPQQPYPQQAYQPPAYPQQGYTAGAPPPYYDGQPTSQQSTNVVVVQPQAQTVATSVYVPNNSDYAIGAIIFAVAITICLLSGGCWYAIICSAIGIAFAASANSSATRGDMETAKQMQGWSVGCTVAALIFTILPIFALIIWIIVVTTTPP